MTLDPETLAYIQQAPPKEWCKTTFIAVQDGNGLSQFMPEEPTPFWGRAFFPELRYWAGLFTGFLPRPTPDLPPQQSRFFRYFNIFCIVYIVFVCTTSKDNFAVYSLLSYAAIMLFIMCAAWCYQHLIRKQNSTTYRPVVSNHNGFEILRDVTE